MDTVLIDKKKSYKARKICFPVRKGKPIFPNTLYSLSLNDTTIQHETIHIPRNNINGTNFLYEIANETSVLHESVNATKPLNETLNGATFSNETVNGTSLLNETFNGTTLLNEPGDGGNFLY